MQCVKQNQDKTEKISDKNQTEEKKQFIEIKQKNFSSDLNQRNSSNAPEKHATT